MGKYHDITGNKYGKLTVLEPINEKLKSGYHKKWLCKCECGNTTIVTSDKVSYNGEEHSISEWSNITGIKANTIIYRLRRGWSIERALTEGVKR